MIGAKCMSSDIPTSWETDSFSASQAQKSKTTLFFSNSESDTQTTSGNKSMKPTDGNHKVTREPTHPPAHPHPTKHSHAERIAVLNVCPCTVHFHTHMHICTRTQTHTHTGAWRLTRSDKWEFTVSCGFSGNLVFATLRPLLLPLVQSSFCNTKRLGIATRLQFKFSSGPSCCSQPSPTHTGPSHSLFTHMSMYWVLWLLVYFDSLLGMLGLIICLLTYKPNMYVPWYVATSGSSHCSMNAPHTTSFLTFKDSHPILDKF